MAIDNDALLAAIEAGRENSYGTDELSDLGKKRAKAIEAYLGLNTIPAPEGRSQVVDRSVYETVSVMLPSLVKIFAGSSDEVCKATPIGPDDERAAEQQTAVLNYIATQQNNWEQICADWIHDAMLLCNGYAMAYWDESNKSIRETYEGQSDDQIAAILMDQGVQVVGHTDLGNGLHDIVIERKENEGKVCIKALPPEHCYVSQDTPDWTLRECPYFEFRQQKTIAELRDMGLDVPEDIADDENEEAHEDDARNRFSEDEEIENGKGLLRRVWARMIWVKADAGEDTRLYYVICVGKTILHAEPATRIPVASMTAQPMPHRHIGMSVAETVMDLQDIRTAVTRGGLDNLYLANNGRHAVSDKVNLDDFLDSRPGGVVRTIDGALPGEGHILPLVHPFAFDSIIGSLEYFDQIRQNRTGASRYFSGTDAGAINKTASGTMALQNMASMRIEHMARMMAPAVEDLFSSVQEIISKHQNKPLTIQLRGQWVMVDPQAWRTKRDLRISVGVGAGNKESMMMQLQMTLQGQMALMPMGLAGPQQLHATVVEMSKLAGFANPDKFWLDPATQPPQPPQIPPEIQKEQMKQQGDLQKYQAEQVANVEIFRAETERERMKLDFEAMNAEREREHQRLIAEMQEATKLTIARMQQEHQAQLETFKAASAAQNEEANRQHEVQTKRMDQEAEKVDALGMVKEALEAYSKQLEGKATAKVERLRDANGKAIGARVTSADGSVREVPIQ